MMETIAECVRMLFFLSALGGMMVLLLGCEQQAQSPDQNAAGQPDDSAAADFQIEDRNENDFRAPGMGYDVDDTDAGSAQPSGE